MTITSRAHAHRRNLRRRVLLARLAATQNTSVTEARWATFHLTTSLLRNRVELAERPVRGRRMAGAGSAMGGLG